MRPLGGSFEAALVLGLCLDEGCRAESGRRFSKLGWLGFVLTPEAGSLLLELTVQSPAFSWVALFCTLRDGCFPLLVLLALATLFWL